MNTELSRIFALVDRSDTTHLAEYLYVGVNRTAQIDFPEPDVKFTWIMQSGESPTDGGDQYTGWDRFGRAIDLRWINSVDVDLERLQHGYDRASNRLYRKNLVAIGEEQDEFYTYDGLYQLKDFQRGELNEYNNGIAGTPAAEEGFTFDPTGNWNAYVTQAGGSTTLNQARTHNRANELTQIDSVDTFVAEDAAGNMTKVPQPGYWDAGYDLIYDAWNRLVEVKDGETTVATYRYDGLNRRVTKTTGGTTRHFYYTDKWQIIEERLTANTAADRQFVWGIRYIDDLILRDRPSERLYVLQDYFQPTAVMDGAGTVLERYGYDAFGTSRVMTPSYGSRSTSSYEWETRFGAYRWDAETGLHQVRNRYLHAGLGRWVTRDPIGQLLTHLLFEIWRSFTVIEENLLNLYGYVRNKPTNAVDPSGLIMTKGRCFPSELATCTATCTSTGLFVSDCVHWSYVRMTEIGYEYGSGSICYCSSTPPPPPPPPPKPPVQNPPGGPPNVCRNAPPSSTSTTIQLPWQRYPGETPPWTLPATFPRY